MHNVVHLPDCRTSLVPFNVDASCFLSAVRCESHTRTKTAASSVALVAAKPAHIAATRTTLYKVDFSFDFHSHTLSGNSCSCALPKDDCIFVYDIISSFGSTLVCPTERFHGRAMACAATYYSENWIRSVGEKWKYTFLCSVHSQQACHAFLMNDEI